jgi:hypothetical protein
LQQKSSSGGIFFRRQRTFNVALIVQSARPPPQAVAEPLVLDGVHDFGA